MRHILRIATFGLLMAVNATATYEPELTLQYRYSKDRLFLTLSKQTTGSLTIRVVPLNEKSERAGPIRNKRLTLPVLEDEIALAPPVAAAHQLTLSLGTRQYAILANRGIWYLGDPNQPHKLTPIYADLSLTHFRNERIIATGASVHIGKTKHNAPLTIGRTFGVDSGKGIKRHRKEGALVLLARATGNCRAVILSVAERLGPTQLRYFDYPLMLDTTLRRYEIPFDKMTQRGEATGQTPQTVYSISLRTVQNSVAGDTLVVHQAGLQKRSPTISQIIRRSKAPLLKLQHLWKTPSILHTQHMNGNTTTTRVTKKQMSLAPDAQSVWLCSHSPSKPVCDPPDAPHTQYSAQSLSTPVVVDDFSTVMPLNRFRMSSTIFAATVDLEQTMNHSRKQDAMQMTYYPQTLTDYAGYVTFVPMNSITAYPTLAVTLRGSIPPGHLFAGIRDQAGREARIPFISYWSGENTNANPLFDIADINPISHTDSEGFRTVLFPVDAFRAVFYNVFEGHGFLNDISGISITMDYAGNDVFHEIELKQIAMTHEQVPIVITAFDNEKYGINSLGGVNFSEDKFGATMDVRLNSDGFYGKGLRVSVALPDSRAYGLVAFGFGKLNVTGYKNLSFSVRGEFGGEDAAVYLNDGTHRAAIQISDIHRVGQMWQKITIPLSDYESEGVSLNHLTQLILAWEGMHLSKRILYFDNFLIE